ncbi:glyoxalase [Bordetella genomosp. 7]|uniref:Glyoxalase n=1 Tax=Bordetella genomosp. 7 TaxID=1416805 RepID=A0A261RHT1_9BORD|nr:MULTISPECIES: VOC family protein [Bordetella]OZI24515.1 glyoxalase [Bordetella genomosp. 7]OZI28555.1 glyoxalase [Bordetella genomosp. 7]
MTSPASEPPRLFPTLLCNDAERMIQWLVDTVGFTEHVVYRHGGVVVHAELAFGSSILMLGQHRDHAYSQLVGSLEGRRTDSLYLAVDDADALYETLRGAGAHIERAIADTDFGSREFSCRDPELNLWTFGTYWPKTGNPPAQQ